MADEDEFMRLRRKVAGNAMDELMAPVLYSLQHLHHCVDLKSDFFPGQEADEEGSHRADDPDFTQQSSEHVR